MVKESGGEGARGRSFVRDLFGLVYSKERPKLPKIFKILKTLSSLKLFRGQSFKDTQTENSIHSFRQ